MSRDRGQERKRSRRRVDESDAFDDAQDSDALATETQVGGRHRGVPVWKQQALDEEGRRRLHGAFKGGFSAGYYNTVGSAEGWTPREFVSTRTQRAAATTRVSDIMDDEDKEELLDAWAQAAQAQEHAHVNAKKDPRLRISGGIGTGVINDLEDDDAVEVEISDYAAAVAADANADAATAGVAGLLRSVVPRELRKSLTRNQLRALGTTFGAVSEMPAFVAAKDSDASPSTSSTTTTKTTLLLLLPREVARHQLLAVPPFQGEERRALYRRYLAYHGGDAAALRGVDLSESDERDFYAAALAAHEASLLSSSSSSSTTTTTLTNTTATTATATAVSATAECTKYLQLAASMCRQESPSLNNDPLCAFLVDLFIDVELDRAAQSMNDASAAVLEADHFLYPIAAELRAAMQHAMKQQIAKLYTLMPLSRYESYICSSSAGGAAASAAAVAAASAKTAVVEFRDSAPSAARRVVNDKLDLLVHRTKNIFAALYKRGNELATTSTSAAAAAATAVAAAAPSSSPSTEAALDSLPEAMSGFMDVSSSSSSSSTTAAAAAI